MSAPRSDPNNAFLPGTPTVGDPRALQRSHVQGFAGRLPRPGCGAGGVDVGATSGPRSADAKAGLSLNRREESACSSGDARRIEETGRTAGRRCRSASGRPEQAPPAPSPTPGVFHGKQTVRVRQERSSEEWTLLRDAGAAREALGTVLTHPQDSESKGAWSHGQLLQSELAQACRWPPFLGRLLPRWFGNHEQTPSAQEAHCALRRHGRRPEAASAHQVERATQL